MGSAFAPHGFVLLPLRFNPLTANDALPNCPSTAWPLPHSCSLLVFSSLSLSGGGRWAVPAMCGGHSRGSSSPESCGRSGGEVWRYRHLGQQCQCHQSHRHRGHTHEEVRLGWGGVWFLLGARGGRGRS